MTGTDHAAKATHRSGPVVTLPDRLMIVGESVIAC